MIVLQEIDNPKWCKGRQHGTDACDKERNQWINKYENMKLKESKYKNGMRKKMNEHVTFKIRNLQG